MKKNNLLIPIFFSFFMYLIMSFVLKGELNPMEWGIGARVFYSIFLWISVFFAILKDRFE